MIEIIGYALAACTGVSVAALGALAMLERRRQIAERAGDREK